MTERQLMCDIVAKKLATIFLEEKGIKCKEAEGEFCHWDLECSICDINFVVECKFRHSTKMNDYSTIYLNKKKVDFLNGKNVLFFYAFLDGFLLFSRNEVMKYPISNVKCQKSQKSSEKHYELNYEIPVSLLKSEKYNERSLKVIDEFNKRRFF